VRGVYPGLPKVLDFLNFQEAITYFKNESLEKKEHEAKKEIFNLLDGSIEEIKGLSIDKTRLKEIKRSWNLRYAKEKELLKIH